MTANKEKTVYALGFFDGVHLGHQALLAACCGLAQKSGCKAGAVTFGIHPETLVAGQAPKLLGTSLQRKALLSCYGMEQVLVLPFDEALRNKPWRTFLEELEAKGAAGFVCGDDFRFGFRGEGNAALLEAYCLEKGLLWAVVPGRSLDGQRISSTHIRKCIEDGDMEQAVRFLGHAHVLSGQVVPGRKLGRTLGIPTANLHLPEGVVVPKFGVYACKALAEGKQYLAVTNVGMRPTVGGNHVTVEPWLLDFEGDLYGKELTLQFYSFLRPEEKFPSLEELKQQIVRDAERVKEILQS